MKKEKPDLETFAAEIAAKQDNPTIHELAKEFPEKTYKELEQYRNADRHEEANQIPLTEAQKNLVDHIESAVKKSKARSGTCITAEMRKDRKDAVEHYEDANYRQDNPADMKVSMGHNESIWFRNECKRLVKERDKEHKLRQEAEGELTILKGIETNRVKEAQDALANALEVNESHQKLNGKLQERITELEEENKTLNTHVEKQVTEARKAGM